jgi:hypothetical protein
MSRETAAVLQGVLAVSVLMTESASEEEILYLAGTSLGSVARGKHAAFFSLAGKQWKSCSARFQHPPHLRTVIERQLEALVPAGGPVVLPDLGWAFAFPLGGSRECWGFLVLLADVAPSAEEELLLRVLAQQTGSALTIANVLGAERDTSAELARTNEALSRSVSDLRRTMEIHARLDRAASSGDGQEGLAGTLHELTGFAVAIEDRFGNLRAWAPGEAPDPYSKPIRSTREQLLRDLASDRYPKRHHGRVIALASPRWDIAGTIALVDPEEKAGKFEFLALEHAATVLAIELLQLTSMAEAELRLRRDLVEELLAGADDEGVLARARALGHDIEQEHRVAIIHGYGRSRSGDNFLHVAWRMARDLGVASLAVQKANTVVLLSTADQDWELFR